MTVTVITNTLVAMTSYRILPGLPAYGPPAISFPDPDAFREGLVVEFIPDLSPPWVGNFVQGSPHLCTSVSLDFGSSAAVIIAGGQGYIVNCEQRILVRSLGFQIEHFWHRRDLKASIICNGLYFEAFTATNTPWRSRRVSWDGIKIGDRFGVIVQGKAYDPMLNTWPSFQLNMLDGSVEGGSYPIELSDAEDIAVNQEGVGHWRDQLKAMGRRLFGR